jgi:DNA modification methylase
LTVKQKQVHGIAPDLAGLAFPVNQLDPLEGNPRRGDVDAIATSFAEFGQRKPIVARHTDGGRGEVTAGNHALAAAVRLGWTHIAVVWADDDDLRAKAWALADNHTAELGSYDRVALAEMVGLVAADPQLFAATAYTNDDLAALLADIEDETGDDDDLDDVPDTAPAHTRPGDLWILGDHRLMCGDCRDPAVVADLLDGAVVNLAVTSPPYAERREYDPSSGFVPIPPDEYVAWFEPVAANVAEHLADDGSWLVNIRPSAEGLDTSLYVIDLVAAHVREWGWHFGAEYCWERSGVPKQVKLRLKNGFEPVYQFARNRWKFRPDHVRHRTDNAVTPMGKGSGPSGLDLRQGRSPVILDQQRPGRPEWSRRQGKPGGAFPDIDEAVAGWAYPSNRLPTFAGSHEALGHMAAFPVGLPAFLTRLFTDPGDVVFDPFVGQASTIMAAHAEGRMGYGIELSPGYVDIACRRFEKATGIVPVRASTGEAVSFVDAADPATR